MDIPIIISIIGLLVLFGLVVYGSSQTNSQDSRNTMEQSHPHTSDDNILAKILGEKEGMEVVRPRTKKDISDQGQNSDIHKKPVMVEGDRTQTIGRKDRSEKQNDVKHVNLEDLQLKDGLMGANQLELFAALKEANLNYHIIPSLNLYSLISEQVSMQMSDHLLHQMSMVKVDFVLISERSSRFLAGIVLESNPKVDYIIKIFTALNLSLIKVPTQHDYRADEILKLLGKSSIGKLDL